MTITWLDTVANRRTPALVLLGAGLLIGSPAAGADTSTTDEDPEGPSLTVYSTADPAGFDPKQFLLQNNGNVDPWRILSIPGFGVVRDTRRIEEETFGTLGDASASAAGNYFGLPNWELYVLRDHEVPLQDLLPLR